jgi:predicted dehydrogenase
MTPISVCIVGLGAMARVHLRSILASQERSEVTFVCEPSVDQYKAACNLFRESGAKIPPVYSDLRDAIEQNDRQIDVAVIASPHSLHLQHATLCLERGMDILIEKPMVLNSLEAKALINTRDRTGRLVVVAFPGPFTNKLAYAKEILAIGGMGQIVTISGTSWQNWYEYYNGTWRQDPDVSGGGFLFDTGSHMLNTVLHLSGQEIIEVCAWLDERLPGIEVAGTIIAKLQSGALVTINACGETAGLGSEIVVCCEKGILKTGQWGEKLRIMHMGDDTFTNVDLQPEISVWEQFLQIRNGIKTNPCPPEASLKLFLVWESILASSKKKATPAIVPRITG